MGRLVTIQNQRDGGGQVLTAEGQRLAESIVKLLDIREDLEIVVRSPDTSTTSKMVSLARSGLTSVRDGIASGRVYDEDAVVVAGVKIRFETANAYASGPVEYEIGKKIGVAE